MMNPSNSTLVQQSLNSIYDFEIMQIQVAQHPQHFLFAAFFVQKCLNAFNC